MIAICKYITENKYSKEGEELFKLKGYVDTRTNGYKLAIDKFRLQIKEWLLTIRAGLHTVNPAGRTAADRAGRREENNGLGRGGEGRGQDGIGVADLLCRKSPKKFGPYRTGAIRFRNDLPMENWGGRQNLTSFKIKLNRFMKGIMWCDTCNSRRLDLII